MAFVLDLPSTEARGRDGVAKPPRRGWLRLWLARVRSGRGSVAALPRLVASLQVTSAGGAVATWSEWMSGGERPGYCVSLLTFPGPDEAMEWIQGCAQGREFAWSERLLDRQVAVLNQQNIGWFMRCGNRRRGAARSG